ncbi:hypothetical protein JD292_04530 [Leucobacter sp. CSA2]|uniref:Uncharacterized protein n=1 Tax=Leucobacter edaphi TaxID=2796472 RepID=A0A934UXI2_9MICO|nr:hypothetical protein [Leucobacter edaphi]MBK0421338.1 hypothetical protein [Leucobacter edaphi]
MSIAQLPGRAAPRNSRADDAAAGSRERLLALVTRIDAERLDVAEELFEEILAHQEAGTGRLTVGEVDALARAGVSTAAIGAPTALPATTRGKLWERQMADRSATVSEVAEMLGVTAARIRQRCAAGTLIAQRRSDGWHLPRFQFPEDREPRGWSTVARSVPRTAPLLLVERVLTSPSAALVFEDEDLAPLDWLARGGDPAAAAIAVDDALNRLP